MNGSLFLDKWKNRFQNKDPIIYVESQYRDGQEKREDAKKKRAN